MGRCADSVRCYNCVAVDLLVTSTIRVTRWVGLGVFRNVVRVLVRFGSGIGVRLRDSLLCNRLWTCVSSARLLDRGLSIVVVFVCSVVICRMVGVTTMMGTSLFVVVVTTWYRVMVATLTGLFLTIIRLGST